MTIRINWPSQAAKGLTSIELYRKVGWDGVLDTLNPGTPYKVLDPSATSFTEALADITEKTCYSYWIAAVKGDERLFGARIVQGFYLDTGPGPQTLLRGDWYCGYFGSLTKDEFFNRAEVLAQLTTAQQSLLTIEYVTWHKFIYRGRIVFIPSDAQVYSTIVTAYNAGMLYGTDNAAGIGPLPDGVVAGTLQNCRVSKAGRQYRIRLPFCTAPYDTALPTSVVSEWISTMGRLYGTPGINYSEAVDALGVSRPVWGDLPIIDGAGNFFTRGSVAQIPLAASTTVRYSYSYTPMQYTSQGNGHTTSTYLRFLFELILP